MADFRRWIFALAVMALLAWSTTTASATHNTSPPTVAPLVGLSVLDDPGTLSNRNVTITAIRSKTAFIAANGNNCSFMVPKVVAANGIENNFAELKNSLANGNTDWLDSGGNGLTGYMTTQAQFQVRDRLVYINATGADSLNGNQIGGNKAR